MSKGSPKIVLRLHQKTIDAIGVRVSEYNRTQRWRVQIDLSQWVRMAIAEKLAKQRRGAKYRPYGRKNRHDAPLVQATDSSACNVGPTRALARG